MKVRADAALPLNLRAVREQAEKAAILQALSHASDNITEAAELLKRPSVCIVGVQIGGWDTHNAQIQGDGQDPNKSRAFGNMQQRLSALGKGLKAIYDEFPSGNVMTLCMSEFGRTSGQNSSKGTDHGVGGLMLAMGPAVNSATQVHNFDETNFTPTSFTDDSSQYMGSQTDYRAVLLEAFEKHMGYVGSADPLFMGYEALKGTTSFYSELGYLA